MKQALILVGHGAGKEALELYSRLEQEIREDCPCTRLVMLHGEPSAAQAAEELAAESVTSVRIVPLLLAPGHHLSHNIADENCEIRRAFEDRGIRTEVVEKGLLQDEAMRAALRTYCTGRMAKP